MKGKEVAELAKHQRMPDRHPKNRAGEIQEGCRREQEVLQVGNPGLPMVPRVQANPKVLQEGDQRFREQNRYLEEGNLEGYCQAVEVQAGFHWGGEVEEARSEQESGCRKELQDGGREVG